jgi:hypothetical protein
MSAFLHSHIKNEIALFFSDFDNMSPENLSSRRHVFCWPGIPRIVCFASLPSDCAEHDSSYLSIEIDSTLLWNNLVRLSLYNLLMKEEKSFSDDQKFPG